MWMRCARNPDAAELDSWSSDLRKISQARKSSFEATETEGTNMNRKYEVMRTFLYRVAWRGILFAIAGVAPLAYAIDPTDVQPAGPLEPGTWEVQEKLKYDDYDRYEAESETSIEYEFTRRLALRLQVPVETEEDENTELGDLKLRLKYILNPDAVRAPFAALTLEGGLPTGEDSEGVDADLRLRLTKPIGGVDSKHALHLTLSEKYVGDEHSDDNHDRFESLLSRNDDSREFLFMAAGGYSYRIGARTTVIGDAVFKQLDRDEKDAKLLEVGIKHDIGKSTTLALGFGAGLDDESPDWTARAGIQFRFGGKR